MQTYCRTAAIALATDAACRRKKVVQVACHRMQGSDFRRSVWPAITLRRHKSMSTAADASSGAVGELEEATGFAALGLDARLVDGLTKMGFTTPTMVQGEVLPAIMEGQDVVIGAETGSGKTLAYLLPLFHDLLTTQTAIGLDYDDLPEALILVPNQELANQVLAVVQSFQLASPELAFPAFALAGATGLPRAKQCAVVVATPSAVLRHTEPGFFNATRYVVVDEADMLLDGGFLADVTRILDFVKPRISNTMRRRRPAASEAELLELLPRRPAQAVFAAATLPDWTGDRVKSVVRWLRQQYPSAVHISTDELHHESARAAQTWVDVGTGDDALPAMAAALERVGAARSMVFVNTVARAKEAAAFLESLGRPALAIHKEVPAADRAASLQAFRAAGGAGGEGSAGGAVLVCTDLAARGLDIPAVGHVVQLDFAPNAVTHLHRIGRTARAGAAGAVTNIVDDRTREVAAAVRAEAGMPLAPVFSRNRGFRRRMKRTGTGRAQIAAPAAAAAGARAGTRARAGGPAAGGGGPGGGGGPLRWDDGAADDGEQARRGAAQ